MSLVDSEEKLPTYCWFALAAAALPALWLAQVIFCLAIGTVSEGLQTTFLPVASLGNLLFLIIGSVQFSLMIGMLTFPLTLFCFGMLSFIQKRFPSRLTCISQDPIEILRRVLIFNCIAAPILMCLVH